MNVIRRTEIKIHPLNKQAHTNKEMSTIRTEISYGPTIQLIAKMHMEYCM